jgi:CRP-like cAMP-binding protein
MTKIFDNISLKNREKICKILEANTLQFKKGTNILTRLTGDNFIGIILRGSIEIIRNDYTGNRTLIDKFSSDDIFGKEISSIENNNYDIYAKDDTEIIFIDYNHIIDSQIIKNDFYIQFIKNLLSIITQKIIEKNEHIEILSKRTTRDKLLEYFKIRSQKAHSNTFYMPITFTDLADYLSVDRSAMTRELKYLKEDGFITITGKKVELKTI